MPGDPPSRICYPLTGIRIDPSRLVADFLNADRGEWAEQDRYQPGGAGWDGLALYSVSGAATDLRCTSRPIVKKTPAGERCPYICNELLPQLQAPLLRVAFYRLRAGAIIGVHRDYGENRSMGWVRIHVPVVTNDRIVIYIGGEYHRFAVGEAWYFDASCAHQVENKGNQDRIHLIVDVRPTPTLDRMLKPIDLHDRVRFARHRLQYYEKAAAALVRFMRTPEGRARIRAKMQVMPVGLSYFRR